MNIVMTGGGSGGHVTPLLAVGHELKQIDPNNRLIYVGQRGDRFGGVVAENAIIDEVYLVSAGKFRRYHGEGLRQLLDVKTVWLNLRDGLRVVAGMWQSWRLLRRLKPDIVFCKGGFVGVPVGLAAALCKVPYVTHDSDAIPGLANRIIARWAAGHAVALNTTHYPYPRRITRTVGVPIAPEYKLVDDRAMRAARKQLQLAGHPVVLVTGGGLGASRLNNVVLQIVPALLRRYPRLRLIHTVGTDHEQTMHTAYDQTIPAVDRARVQDIGYTTELQRYSTAADVVIARGGATNFAELAAQGKPAIIVPNPLLTGGHQLKNAEIYAQAGAVVLVREQDMLTNPDTLLEKLCELLDDREARMTLSTHIVQFARPAAARELAEYIMSCAQGRVANRV